MAHSQFGSTRPVVARIAPLVAGSTLLLTLSFFGLIAFGRGGVAGVGGRVPFYVLAAAVTFAAALFGLDRRAGDGRNLLALSVAAAAVAFVLVTLGVEGVAYAITSPAEALSTNTVLYLLSAALVTTGLGYWVANHLPSLMKAIRRSGRYTR